MKKILKLGVLLGLLILALAGCGAKGSQEGVLKIGASAIPHAEILNLIKDDLAAEGVTLDVIEFNDYVKPNLALANEEIDANYFQHKPYLDDFKTEHNLKLETLTGVHIEPMGVYSNKVKSIDISKLEKGSTVAIPNDVVNQGRALLLLQEHGLIKLDEKAGITASERDIIINPLNLKFKILEAPQIPRIIDDVTIALINGNYALGAGLNPIKDSIALEDGNSPYVNIVAIREGDKRDELEILKKHLLSDKVKRYINDKYNGGVVATFK